MHYINFRLSHTHTLAHKCLHTHAFRKGDTHAHTGTHTHPHIHTHTHTHTFTHTWVHKGLHTYIQEGLSTHRLMQIQAYTHSCIQHFIQLNTSTGTKRMKNLTESFKSNGLVPRTRGNTRRLPKHTLSYETQKSVVTFLFNFSSQNSLVLPGRVPGFSKTDIRLLPSSLSKRAIWRQYKEATESVGDQSVAYTTFCRLWQTPVPYRVVMKPITDLCWQCQWNSAALSRTANNPLAEKTAAVRAYSEHLELVQTEGSYYKTQCDSCKKSLQDHLKKSGQLQPPSLSSCTPQNSVDIESHYSFDYAQQVGRYIASTVSVLLQFSTCVCVCVCVCVCACVCV